MSAPNEYVPNFIPMEAPQHKTPPSYRMSVNETVYYEGMDEESSASYGKPFDRAIVSDERPYQRDLKLDDKWRILESGWLPKVGMIHIDNRGQNCLFIGTLTPQAVSDKDRDMHSPKQEDITPTPLIKIRPGESARFEPVSVGLLLIKADIQEGSGLTVRCVVTMLPN